MGDHPVRIFVRQPLTRSGPADRVLVQQVLDALPGPARVEVLTGREAVHAGSFHQDFERSTGLAFTPRAFRRHRLGLLDRAEAMLVVRTGLSESGAFELAYNVFGPRVPVFVAIHRSAPITTTLLRDLQDLCPVRYVTFDDPVELEAPLADFVASARRAGPPADLLEAAR